MIIVNSCVRWSQPLLSLLSQMSGKTSQKYDNSKPVAVQVNVTLSPTVTIWSGKGETTGRGAASKKKTDWTKNNYY